MGLNKLAVVTKPEIPVTTGDPKRLATFPSQ